MKRLLTLLALLAAPAVLAFGQYSGKTMAKLCNVPPQETAFVYVDAPIVQMWAPEGDLQYLEPVKDCIRILCPDEMVGKSVHFRLITEQGSIFDVMARIKLIDPKEVHTPGFCFDFTTAECSYKLANAELAIKHAERFPLWGKLSEDDPYGDIKMVSRQVRTTPRADDMETAVAQALALGDRELLLYMSKEVVKICQQHKDADKILRSVFKTNTGYVKDVLSEDAQCDILMEIANTILKQK